MIYYLGGCDTFAAGLYMIYYLFKTSHEKMEEADTYIITCANRTSHERRRDGDCHQDLMGAMIDAQNYGPI